MVVTRGSKGALAFQAGQIRTQAIKAARVVDTLGAGDGFIAGFLAERLKGAALDEQLAAGARNAARICEHRGAFGHETKIRPGQPGVIRPAANAGTPTLPPTNKED